ncbi:hypothetical protein HY633_05350 [Candidatus Uhrbacteria bacterium]|nr:hypothetical protein [Candidatus Uhrbacteria bacterium]
MNARRAMTKFFRRPGLGYAAVFIFALAVGAYLQSTPTFIDPDSFYHLKMAELTAADGPVRDFPWLPFTTLGAAFADHHFLYHVALIPFMAALGPVAGAKTATVIFFALAIAAFYALLRQHAVRSPWFYALVLATSGGFVFRMNLVKTSALSVFILFFALLAVEKKAHRFLFVLSWLYVWTYGGWPLLPIVVGAMAAARVFAIWKLSPTRVRMAFGEALRRGRGHLEMLGAAVGGSIVGLVFNPYFPRNLAFYWEQIVQIGIVNYRGTIGVGGEWYGYSFADIFGGAGLLFILLLCGLALLLIIVLFDLPADRRRPFAERDLAPFIASLALAALFLFMTLRSRRFVEYFQPFMALFVALFLDALLPKFSLPAFRRGTKKIIAEFGLLPAAAAIFLIGLFPFIAVRDIRMTREVYAGGLPVGKYAAAADWLAANTPEGSVVFHSDWDDFPPLFYRDTRNRFISGLDPTFFYRQDGRRYWQWVHITTGKRKSGIADIVRRGFGAEVVLIEKDHKEMREVIEADANFSKVYADDEVDIYAISDHRDSGAQ